MRLTLIVFKLNVPARTLSIALLQHLPICNAFVNMFLTCAWSSPITTFGL